MQTNLSQNIRVEEVRHMEKTKQMYLTAREIAGILNMSVSYSYTIVAQLNMELEKMGKYVIHGKVPTQFFLEKFYGLNVTDEMLEQIRLKEKEDIDKTM